MDAGPSFVGASKMVKWQRLCLPIQEMQEIRFNLWVQKVPGSRKWQPTPVFLPGKFHGQKSLAGYSPWGLKELDTTEPGDLGSGFYFSRAHSVIKWE